ncbi:hypothetical protein BKA80DRAFT_340801 [Phyllosticta citrichinensis]
MATVRVLSQSLPRFWDISHLCNKENRRVLVDISNASLPDLVAASAEKEKATTKAPKKRPAPEEASDGEDDRELWEKIQEQYTFVLRAYTLTRTETNNTEEAVDKSKTTTKKKGSGSITAADLADITLPKEDTDEVEVYDSCDEIREKINAHLREPGVTQAQFCRDLAAMCHTPKKPKSIQSRQLTAFRDQKEADAGNTSVVYYAAYVFFEKLRLKDGKPKSSHRKGMEEAWCANDGMDVDRPHNRGIWVGPDVKEVKQDQFGRGRRASASTAAPESASAAFDEGLDEWQRHMRKQILRREVAAAKAAAKAQKKARREAKAKAAAAAAPRRRYCEVAFPADEYPWAYY